MTTPLEPGSPDHTSSGPLPGPLRALLHRLIDVRDEELSAMLWSCAYFFLLFSSYYILRPLRDSMGITAGVKNLPWLVTGTLAGMLLANPLFGALVSRLPRRRFIPLVYRFFISNLLLFYVLLRFLPPADQVQVARAFYIWTSVFNLFAVSVFWSLMADLFTPEQGRRLFGFIGVGGTSGAILGSLLTSSLAEALGAMNLLLAAAVLLEGAVWTAKHLVRRGEQGVRHTSDAVPRAPELAASRSRIGVVLDGFRLVVRSPYLLLICSYLLLFTVTSTFLYFEQAKIVEKAIGSASERTALFARIDLYVNLLTVVFQVFLTGRILARIGVGAALAILPAITLAGFLWIGAAPVLWVLVTVQVVRRAGDFALARPAREVLFTVVGREEKYVSKNLIDTFVYRGGDTVGAWVFSALSSLGPGAAVLALVGAPLAVVWMYVGRALGRRQQALAGAAGEEEQAVISTSS